MDYEIRRASILDVRPMATRMRAAACVTLQSFGFKPRQALHRVYISSFYCRTALIDDRPVAMWGIMGTLMSECAYVWLVMSDGIANVPRTIIREAKAELSEIMANYSDVATTVLPEDDAAVRFALYLGFADRAGEFRNMPRKDLERELRDNPRHRVPIGDQYVLGLSYHPGVN